MLALVIALGVVVALLGLLVAGLLRSHADILRALHSLGAGVGDPSNPEDSGSPDQRVQGHSVPLTIGPPLPVERTSTSAPDISGVTPEGDALAIAMANGNHLTLLAFLSSGCSTCSGFWRSLAEPHRSGLPGDVRLAIVTKGPELEIPNDVRARATGSVPVVMSSQAWDDYEVPGSPFFILVDGASGGRVGEGVANEFRQIVDLVGRARHDRRSYGVEGPTGAAGPGMNGGERETANDRELMAAGIRPGHPSLYPTKLADIFEPTRPRPAGEGAGTKVPSP